MGAHVHGHDWTGAALTPYVLDAGAAARGHRATSSPRPASACASATASTSTAPAGDGAFRVTGIAHARPGADPDQSALFFASGRRARSSPARPGT